MFRSVRHEFVQHLRHRLNLGSGEHDVCPADCYVRVRRIRRKLVTDEGIKPDALPTAFAQQGVGGRHGLNASVQRLKKSVNRVAALARGHRDHCNLSEDVFDPVVKLGDQQLLLPLDLLAFDFDLLAFSYVAQYASEHPPPGYHHLADCKLHRKNRPILALSRYLTSTSDDPGLTRSQVSIQVAIVFTAV